MQNFNYSGKAFACWNKDDKERPWSIRLMGEPFNGTLYQCISFNFVGMGTMLWCRTDEMKNEYSMPGRPSGIILLRGEIEINDAERA